MIIFPIHGDGGRWVVTPSPRGWGRVGTHPLPQGMGEGELLPSLSRGWGRVVYVLPLPPWDGGRVDDHPFPLGMGKGEYPFLLSRGWGRVGDPPPPSRG